MENNTTKVKLNFSLDWRIASAVLAAVIIAMLIIWQPWQASDSDRTVQVTGESSLKAVPDEFVFYPSYQVKNSDREAALAELTKKTDEVVAGLKDLGVPASGIQTSSSGYDLSYPEGGDDETTYYTQVTVTVDNQELAQKAQDYLVTTGPTGSISPQYGFSDRKQKELEARARDLATKDARAKADQMGENLGFAVGKVKSVTDGAGFGGGPIPFDARASEIVPDSSLSLKLSPGENELSYSVDVVYFIR
jgi:hypothetical protein